MPLKKTAQPTTRAKSGERLAQRQEPAGGSRAGQRRHQGPAHPRSPVGQQAPERLYQKPDDRAHRQQHPDLPARKPQPREVPAQEGRDARVPQVVVEVGRLEPAACGRKILH